MTKKFSPFVAGDAYTHRPVFLPGPIRRSFAAQLTRLKRGGEDAAGAPVPVLLGEFGIPFDLEGSSIKALDRSFRAVEDNLLNCTLWNYTSDNTNARGDGWNGEDLSIFSRDQQDGPGDVNSGGRGLQAVVRPYPRATAGEPRHMAFDIQRHVFEFEFRHDPTVAAATEIFVPEIQYAQGYRVEVSDGTVERDPARQTLIYRHDPGRREHKLRISPAA